jgi:ELWxxDGT repeat protein
MHLHVRHARRRCALVAALILVTTSAAALPPPQRLDGAALGVELSGPRDLTVFRDALYFSAADASRARGLWRTDGETAASVLLPPELARDEWAGPNKLTVFHDRLIFEAWDQHHGYQLWSYDGAETHRLTEFPGGTCQPIASDLVVHGDRLYFVPWSDEIGQELWAYDGAAVELAADIWPGPQGSAPDGLASTPSGLLFWAQGSPVDQSRPWRYESGAAEPFSEWGPTSSEGEAPANYPAEFTVLGDELIIISEAVPGYRPWRLRDGHWELIDGIRDVQSNIIDWNGQFVLFARANAEKFTFQLGGNVYEAVLPGNTVDLWRYDGSGVEKLADADFSARTSNAIGEVHPHDDAVVFAGKGDEGFELWTYEEGKISLLGDINQQLSPIGGQPGSSTPRGFTDFRGDIYFQADDGVHGPGLWRIPTSVATPEPGSLGLTATAAALYLVDQRRKARRLPAQ